MPWTNYHSHTNYCDGSSDPEDYISRAIDEKLVAYGFSAHAPMKLSIDWCVKDNQFDNYLSKIEKLKNNYYDKIQIYNGLEIDYIPGISGRDKHLNKDLVLDYFIGSIHFVEQFNDGMPWGIDHNFEIFQHGLKEIFKNDIKAAVVRYYELTREMLITDQPDIVGHVDKIKMFNKEGKYFKESEKWYKDQVLKTLKIIKESGVIVEVNTRGFYHYNQTELYPSEWILELIKEWQIPLMINSDCHRPEEITGGIAHAANRLQKLGTNKIWSLIDGLWKPFGFNEAGLVF